MTNKGIFLVNAGNDPSIASMSNDYSFPALGIISLGTWLKKRIPDLEVICRDGAARSTEQIKEEIARINPSLVGISTLCTSYQNSLEIAKAAKEIGAKVVLGNDQASQTSRLILENRPQVDYVVGHEYGELPLEMLVRNLRGENISLSKIPTLTYRECGEVKGFDFRNPQDKATLSIMHPQSGYWNLLQELSQGKRIKALDIFPIVDRTLYPQDHWDAYLKNYLSKFANYHTQLVTGVTTMNRARGCNRQGDAKCKHCDMLLDISMSSPELFWEEVRTAHEQVQATSFYECCDSFSSFPGLIKSITKAKPSDLGFNPEFYVYCQAADLAEHPERVQMLKEMGVFRVNMGLESMSNRTLRHMKGLGDSVDKNYKSLELLKKAGIHVYSSYVLGSEAETTETLRETTERVCGLIREGYLCDAEVQPVLPLHGNYQGKVLSEHGMIQCEGQPVDWPTNVDLLSKRYVDNFSGVSHTACVDTAKEIRACAARYRINYGSGASTREQYN